jgi:beta-lactamase regulating signal transducer with metallopeptidase domain
MPMAILFFYGFFCAVVITLYLRKWQKVYAIARKAREIDDPIISDIASKVKKKIRIGRDIRIMQSDKCPYAMVWGIFRPRVILPSYYLRWTPGKIKAILRHEFAHVKQHDNLFLLLTIVVSAFYWFNPLVWILIRRHTLEREISCDDMAIGTGSRPLTYAAYLVDIIKMIKFQDAKGVKPVMLTYESNIKARLRFLLGENVKRHIIGLRQIIIMAGVTIALTSLISSVSIWAETLSGDSDNQKEKSEFIKNLRKNSDSTLFSGKYYKVLKAQGPESTWDKQVGKAAKHGYKCYADGSFSYPGDGRVIMHDVAVYDDTKEWRFEADGVTLYRDDNGDIRWEMESLEDYIRTEINVNGVKLKYKVTDSSLRSNTELLWREFYIDGVSFPFGETQLEEFQEIVEEIYDMFKIGDSSTIRIIKH